MRRTVGIAAVVYGVGILLSRVVGLIREAVIGRVLGAGGEADVFWASFVIPDFLNYLLAGGVLSIVFIPIFQGYLTRGDDAGGWRSFSVIANSLCVLAVLGTVALWVAAPWIAPAVVPGLSPAQHAELVHLVRIILPAQIFHVVGGLVSATLQAQDRHLLPALAPVVYAGSIVLGGLLLGPSLGSAGFAWGVLAGSLLGPFMLPLAGALRHGLVWRPVLALRHPDLRRYLWQALPVMVGFSIVVVDDWVVKYFASEMEEGTIARLQYARTLMKVPMGVFGMAAAMAAYPTLTRLAAEGRRGEMYATLVGALRTMLVLAFGAQAALSVAGAEMAEVIWGTRRFTAEALLEIGLYTALLSIGLWAWAAQSLVARGFYAQGKTWKPTLIGSALAGALVPVYWLLADRGGPGLAVASSVAISAYVLLLVLALRRDLSIAETPPRGLPDAVLRLLPAVALGVGAGLLLEGMLPPLPALLRGALSGGVALALYLATAHLLQVPEVGVLVRAVRRRLLRSPSSS